MEDLLSSYAKLWDSRDRRVDGLPLMSSPLPTAAVCLGYVVAVKVWGPWYMRDRKPMDIKGFMMVYNACQVLLSTYLFVNALRAGWWGDYSFRCQPVDFSDSPKALQMVHVSYVYFLAKFTEFADTFCFVARKKFGHVSALHVVHHGIMPLSVWPGLRWLPGGHSTFFGLINSFVHMFMYAYYLAAAAATGPKGRRRLSFWKRHMTNLQMVSFPRQKFLFSLTANPLKSALKIQFVAMVVHSVQVLFYDDCDYPKFVAFYIMAHAVLFFGLFSQFYVAEYLSKRRENAKKKE